VFSQGVLNAPEDFLSEHHGDSVPQLSHVLAPASFENISIWKCLQAARFTDGEISDPAVRIKKHIFPAGNPVVARLQSFGGRVQRAAGVAGVGTRTRLENMILKLDARRIPARLSEIGDSVSDRSPRLAVAIE